MTNQRRERKQTRVRNGSPKTIPIFFPLVSNSIQPLPSLQCSQNSITNKRTKEKILHPLSSYSFSKPCPRNTLFHYLTIIPIIPIRSSYRELTFRVKLLLRSHARSKVYKNIYIYTHSLYIYTRMYTYIYCMHVCVYCEIGVIHSKRHATSLVHNYADNHNVPEGNWCAWRDLITYAILCTRIKQKGVGG